MLMKRTMLSFMLKSTRCEDCSWKKFLEMDGEHLKNHNHLFPCFPTTLVFCEQSQVSQPASQSVSQERTRNSLGPNERRRRKKPSWYKKRKKKKDKDGWLMLACLKDSLYIHRIPAKYEDKKQKKVFPSQWWKLFRCPKKQGQKDWLKPYSLIHSRRRDVSPPRNPIYIHTYTFPLYSSILYPRPLLLHAERT